MLAGHGVPAADQLDEARRRASEGAGEAGWSVRQIARSPVTGRAGTIEFLLHAKRLV
jgi:predicted rRNA methylase YqxC with S4 and FtsJ domains